MTFKITTKPADPHVQFSYLKPGDVFRLTPGGSLFMKLGRATIYKAASGKYLATAVGLQGFNATNIAEDRNVYPTTIEAHEV